MKVGIPYPGHFSQFFGITLLLMGLPMVGHALIIDSYSAAANDRFANAAEFIAADYNLSGITIAPNNTWLTLVAPNVYLASDHYKPSVGATVTFYATNDPNGPTITRQVTSNRLRFGTSDLTIGTLDRPVPEGYAVYSYATETFSNSPPTWNNYPYRNETLFHIGKSPGTYSTSLRTAVGQNKLERRNMNVVVSNPDANGPSIEVDRDDPGSADFVPYETQGRVGDSGGPLLFRYTDGTGQPALRVVGIAWYTDPDATTFTGFTPVGQYATDITNFINANGLGFVPAAPAALVAEAVDVNSIALTWEDLSNIETSYELERSPTSEGNWLTVATLDASTTSFLDVGLDADSSYDYRVRAMNANGASDYSAVASASTPPVATFSDWQIDTGLSEMDEADAAVTADPDGDGIANLLEYALGGDPLIPNSASLPQISVDNTYMTITFLRLRSDIDYRIEASDDLVNWSVIAENPGSVGSWVTVDDVIPIAEAHRRFLRLEVVLP
jgi:hypothetical protein